MTHTETKEREEVVQENLKPKLTFHMLHHKIVVPYAFRFPQCTPIFELVKYGNS